MSANRLLQCGRKFFAEYWSNQSINYIINKSTVHVTSCVIHSPWMFSCLMGMVDEHLKRVVVSVDFMYIKTHGHQLLVNSLCVEKKIAIH